MKNENLFSNNPAENISLNMLLLASAILKGSLILQQSADYESKSEFTKGCISGNIATALTILGLTGRSKEKLLADHLYMIDNPDKLPPDIHKLKNEIDEKLMDEILENCSAIKV